MDGFICLKALRLGGAEYLPGDAVPGEAVLPQRAPVLLAQKYLVKAAPPVETAAEHPALISVPILRDGEAMTLELEPEQVALAVELVQRTAKEAVEAVGRVDSDGVLILIDILDGRKSVKEAAAARAKELAGGAASLPGDGGG